MRNKILKVEISLDGSRGGIFEDRLLVCGLEWDASKQVFQMSFINKTWEDYYLLTINGRRALNVVLHEMEVYRKEARSLQIKLLGTVSYLSDLVNSLSKKAS